MDMEKEKLTKSMEDEAEDILYKIRCGNDDVVCPRCKKKPTILREGKYNESLIVRCECGLVHTAEKGI